ncbi:hypothetical protein HK405_004092 [Cladochytrium tenue]|nr:hypothetical protein HK405_004092 [Cladochytrium tenue]
MPPRPPVAAAAAAASAVRTESAAVVPTRLLRAVNAPAFTAAAASHPPPAASARIPCGAVSPALVGATVSVAGWAANPRRIGSDLAFLPLRDASGAVQLVVTAAAATANSAASVTAGSASSGFHTTDADVTAVPSAVAEQLTDDLRARLLAVSPESVVTATGVVRRRPSSAARPGQGAAGDLELVVQSLDVLNPADPLPFPLLHLQPSSSAGTSGGTPPKAPASEETLLKYRYLDLRRPQLQANLRKRSDAVHAVRSLLHDEGFCEVETPYLFKSTPEGAREFLVPTRSPGQFYALTQSPQQFKQVLMSTGIEKYYQFARCFRDESLGADRQPEFTQLDLEMAFCEPAHVMGVIERVVARVWSLLRPDAHMAQPPFPTMPYAHAMRTYGSDKPDTRYGLEIQNVTEAVDGRPEPEYPDPFRRGTAVEALVVKADAAAALSAKDRDAVLQAVLRESFPLYGGTVSPRDLVLARAANASKLLLSSGVLGGAGGSGTQPPIAPDALLAALGASEGDLVAVARRPAGLWGGNTPMGRVRTHLATRLREKGALAEDPDAFNFLWVVDFPLFTPAVEEVAPGQAASTDTTTVSPLAFPPLEATHHPFTAPAAADQPHLFSNPLRVRAQHYDLVLNGAEVAGGSVRVHRAPLQRRIMQDLLRIPAAKVDRDFGHLLDALSLGCPPHGGVAIGFDRLMAIACGARSIRDVIAFPKLRGGDLFAGSPNAVDPARLKEYGL